MLSADDMALIDSVLDYKTKSLIKKRKKKIIEIYIFGLLPTSIPDDFFFKTFTPSTAFVLQSRVYYSTIKSSYQRQVIREKYHVC